MDTPESVIADDGCRLPPFEEAFAQPSRGQETKPIAHTDSHIASFSTKCAMRSIPIASSLNIAAPEFSPVKPALGLLKEQGCLPPARQSVLSDLFPRKEDFVESLVEIAAKIVEAPSRQLSCAENASKRLVPMKLFISELLKRSRTSFSTLQLTLLYYVRFKQNVASHTSAAKSCPTSCARRMFLSALITASKYLQDRNYSNRAWSKLCGLPATELTKNESSFLDVIKWNLFVSKSCFAKWSTMLMTASAHLASTKQQKGVVVGGAGAGVSGSAVLPIHASLPRPQNVHVNVNVSKLHPAAAAPRLRISQSWRFPADTGDAPLTPPVDEPFCGKMAPWAPLEDAQATATAVASYLPSPDMAPIADKKRSADHFEPIHTLPVKRVANYLGYARA
ncbi:cyclin-domain-containing protein [Fimicolochytrium jonesii]|uniref:cyclin-domain-containing protein n=1 Tax=Fimicolochytrium jonesii TaxID=1396493 RepID=UPI0022FE0F6F|nr:cyclin-domain-containing protein [Fimicolochytrium jonesii]KAI8824992.1 cyclin-domain-containing protein [Fimicolochytrium jonesii]